jgi:hydrogenase nickel incorporation protein HypA/HybF
MDLWLWYNDRRAGAAEIAAPSLVLTGNNNAMHELPITQGILDTALSAARQAGAQRVMAIDLVIGELSGIVDDSVQFYFDILSKGTPAQGAVLRFQRQPAQAVCLDCGYQYDAAPPLAPFCPACASLRVQVTGGRQFLLESIEIDDQSLCGAEDPQR